MTLAPISDAYRELPPPKPPIKFAGGKTKLLPLLRTYLTEPFRFYFEPFVGGGSVVLDLVSRSACVEGYSNVDASSRRYPTLPARFFVSDVNADLIALYRTIKDDVENLIDRLVAHYPSDRDAQLYYAERRLWNDAPVGTPERDDAVIRAARLLYLNASAFNGLWRERKDGGMNVPFGRYNQPLVFNAANLRAVARALRTVCLNPGDFEPALAGAGSKDLVYLDPPYAPALEDGASFVAYSRDGFTWEDQARLCKVATAARDRGARVVASNSSSRAIRDMWEDAGFEARAVTATRAIAASGASRGDVTELVFLGGFR